MVTLDRWREFAATPKALVFPRLELIGRDHAPPIVAGAGEIRMDTPSQFAFTLSGTPTDIGYALRELNRHRDNPYDAQARPRLIGIDAAGISWSGGYTIPHVTTRSSGWTFGGEIESLLTNEQSAAVSLQAGTELIFLLRINDPMAQAHAVEVLLDQTWSTAAVAAAPEQLGGRLRQQPIATARTGPFCRFAKPAAGSSAERQTEVVDNTVEPRRPSRR